MQIFPSHIPPPVSHSIAPQGFIQSSVHEQIPAQFLYPTAHQPHVAPKLRTTTLLPPGQVQNHLENDQDRYTQLRSDQGGITMPYRQQMYVTQPIQQMGYMHGQSHPDIRHYQHQ